MRFANGEGAESHSQPRPDAPIERPSDEIKRLQRCLNDLVSLLALPAMWTGREPAHVVTILLESLLGILDLDFIYVRLSDSAGQVPTEITRVSRRSVPTLQVEHVAEMLDRALGRNPRDWSPAVVDPAGGQRISLVPVRLGLHGEVGTLVAASRRLDFPLETERLLLSVGTNQVSVGLQEARLLHEQKTVARQLDEKVAQRTAELATANEELRAEICERRKIEERLRTSEAAVQNAFHQIKNSEAKLRQVIDTIPTLAWCNLPDGPNEFLNKGWHEYTGLTPEESHGWGWKTAFHPDDLPPLMETWLQLLHSGEPGEIEARLRRFDGVYRWFLIRVEPFRDESGKIVRWYGTSTDIEDRKRAEERLRRSEAFLAEGEQLSQIGSFSWRVATNEITWSEQLYRIYEFDRDMPVTPDLIRTRVHPEDVSLIDKMTMVNQASDVADDFEWHWRLMMPDRRIKYLHAVVRATRCQDGQVEYIAAVQDITQRVVSEEALGQARNELARVSRIKMLAVLTAAIAHELNQPLSGIITNASTCVRMLAAEPPNVDGARETARRTIRDGNRAADVIARLRALFAKKQTANELVDVNDATREVIALSATELQKNRVSLRTEFAENLPLVMGDRVQLQQVILNLIRNGSDAMNSIDDRPRMLSVKSGFDQDDRVFVSVQDSGVGFDAENVDKLFEAFYTTKADGMGIGLSVSRSIIESHRGRLWASKNNDSGATFTFSIPCRQEEATSVAGAA